MALQDLIKDGGALYGMGGGGKREGERRRDKGGGRGGDWRRDRIE